MIAMAATVRPEGIPMLGFGAVVGAALLGFCAGLWSFKVKSRWCPECGRPTWPLCRRGG